MRGALMQRAAPRVAALLAGVCIALPAAAFPKIGEVRAAELPPEARETLSLVRRGGPFPYARDGVVFGNREALLPARPRGYYREYTVKTPRARDRGARRLVAGGGVEFFYSDDHYRSFRRVIE